jgi:serine/threonine-protein kinase haspin
VGVCRGPYPAALVKAWEAWDKRHKSENDFIGGLPDEQLYAVFAMANCGRDLESYQLQGYEQVRSMMLQVGHVYAVAVTAAHDDTGLAQVVSTAYNLA